MLKKIRDFDSKYSSILFLVSIFIIIIFLASFNVSNRDKEKTCTIPNEIVDNYTNYSYNITYISNDKNVELYIKRYNSKYLIEKKEEDVKNTYYVYYTDIYEKASNNEYIKFRKDNIVEGLDNKYLFLDYINDISLKSSIKNDSGLTCYINRELELSMCINLDDSISVKGNDFELIYEVNTVGEVKEFDVNIIDEFENIFDDEMIIE